MTAEYQASHKPKGQRIQSIHHEATKPIIAGIIYAVKALVSNAKLLKIGFGGTERNWWRGMAPPMIRETAMEGKMERPIGIEPTPEPWQGSVLPLY
jgi:hypothetical protein